MNAHHDITSAYDAYISRALATEGGHLSIGRGGYSLHFERGARLSGYDCAAVKAACIAAGLPVIDSRMVEFDTVARLAINGPMVAVGEPPPCRRITLFPMRRLPRSRRLTGRRERRCGTWSQPG